MHRNILIIGYYEKIYTDTLLCVSDFKMFIIVADPGGIKFLQQI